MSDIVGLHLIYFQPSPRWLFIPIMLRFLFLPFFLLCNFKPTGVERMWPTMMHWDYAFWAAVALFGLTGGYFSSLSMMYCPRYGIANDIDIDANPWIHIQFQECRNRVCAGGWNVRGSFDRDWNLCWNWILLLDANHCFWSRTDIWSPRLVANLYQLI